MEAGLKDVKRNGPLTIVYYCFYHNGSLFSWKSPILDLFFLLKLGSYNDTMGLFSLIGQDGFLQGGDDGNSQGLQGACGT